MRWWTLPVLAIVAWFVYTLTPLYALSGLARDVQAGDVEAVERRVNFRTLRLSLVRQATATVRSAMAADPSLDSRERQRLNDAATGIALALAESLVTAKTVTDLLDDGWPEGLEGPRPDRVARPRGLRVDGIGSLIRFYLASEMRGFRTVVMAAPPDAPRADQLRLRLRLRGTTWRLIDLEVTESLRDRFAQKLAKALARVRSGDRGEPRGEPRPPAAPPVTPPGGEP